MGSHRRLKGFRLKTPIRLGQKRGELRRKKKYKIQPYSFQSEKKNPEKKREKIKPIL